MRRALRQLAVFLSLGVAVNVGVAWGCALFVDVRRTTPTKISNASPKVAPVWRVDRWMRHGGLLVHSQRYVGTGMGRGVAIGRPSLLVPEWTGFASETARYASRERQFESRLADARGWPMLAMWSETDNPFGVDATVRAGCDLTGWFDRGAGRRRRVLPLRPVAIGFVVNSLAYAAIFFSPFLPFELRRSIRRRRGRCIRCGYPIGASPICSECGRPVSSVTARRAMT